MLQLLILELRVEPEDLIMITTCEPSIRKIILISYIFSIVMSGSLINL